MWFYSFKGNTFNSKFQSMTLIFLEVCSDQWCQMLHRGLALQVPILFSCPYMKKCHWTMSKQFQCCGRPSKPSETFPQFIPGKMISKPFWHWNSFFKFPSVWSTLFDRKSDLDLQIQLFINLHCFLYAKKLLSLPDFFHSCSSFLLMTFACLSWELCNKVLGLIVTLFSFMGAWLSRTCLGRF